MLGKTSWYSIDVSGNDRHILFFYKKCHFCHLVPFAEVGQNNYTTTTTTTDNNLLHLCNNAILDLFWSVWIILVNKG